MKIPVGCQNLAWEPSMFKQEVNELALDLVKAFPDVGAAPSNGLPFQPSLLEVQPSGEPCILGASGSCGPGEELLTLPSAYPLLEVFMPYREVQPVELGEDG